jgi:hypothetical protein
MTEAKFQWSDRFDNMILLARGDTLDELAENVAGILAHFAPDVAPVKQDNGVEQVSTEKFIEVESIDFVGKNRWVVKGGWAKQYGITCWPEVLEAAGIMEYLKLDEPNVPGGKWLAHYREVEKDGKMKADKVIRLEKVG